MTNRGVGERSFQTSHKLYRISDYYPGVLFEAGTHVPAPVYSEYSTRLRSNEVSSTCRQARLTETSSHHSPALLAESNQESHLRIIVLFFMKTNIFVSGLPKDFSSKITLHKTHGSAYPNLPSLTLLHNICT